MTMLFIPPRPGWSVRVLLATDISKSGNGCTTAKFLVFRMEDMIQAQTGGHQDVVERIIDQCGANRSEICMDCVAISGEISLAKFMLNKGYFMTPLAYFHASERDDLDYIKWAFNNGCLKSGNEIRDAGESGSVACMEWGYDNGFDFVPRAMSFCLWSDECSAKFRDLCMRYQGHVCPQCNDIQSNQNEPILA